MAAGPLRWTWILSRIYLLPTTYEVPKPPEVGTISVSCTSYWVYSIFLPFLPYWQEVYRFPSVSFCLWKQVVTIPAALNQLRSRAALVPPTASGEGQGQGVELLVRPMWAFAPSPQQGGSLEVEPNLTWGLRAARCSPAWTDVPRRASACRSCLYPAEGYGRRAFGLPTIDSILGTIARQPLGLPQQLRGYRP